MELDDFCAAVGTSRVLTGEEALDVVLHMKNATPHNRLTFSDKLRVNTWTDQFFTDAYLFDHMYVGTNVQQYFSITIPKGQIVISSIYFINFEGHQLSVNFTRDGNVRKLENRLHQGQQLYEAVFNPPVPVKSGNHMITFSCTGATSGGTYEYYNAPTATQLKGSTSLRYKDAVITVPENNWYFLVGFKLRKA